MRVVCLDEMQKIEKQAGEKFGFSESLIIESVGIEGAQLLYNQVLKEQSYYAFSELVFLIGKGNNGADGLAIARNLVNKGYRVRAFILFPDEKPSEEYDKQLKMASAYGVKITHVRETFDLSSYFSQITGNVFVVDAILGTGVRLPISNYLFEVISIVNSLVEQKTALVASVDIPSGVAGDSGEVNATAVKAAITMSVGPYKQGLFVGQGPLYAGELLELDAGFPRELMVPGDKYILAKDQIISEFPDRDHFSHKYDFGHTLIIGGSQGLTGALIMAAHAALKVGTGLVTAATWPVNYGELATRVGPEVILGIIPKKEDLEETIKSLNRYDTVVVGPGLGRTKVAREIILELLNNYSRPVILDADAMVVLNFEQDRELLQSRRAPTIMTPHLAEFATFVDEKMADVQRKPLDFVKTFVDKTNCGIVLNGPCTLLGFPNGEICINYRPNSGLARAGTGDVLAGILGGLMAQVERSRHDGQQEIFIQNSKIYEALRLGVFLHSESGMMAREAFGERSMTAMNVVDSISKVLQELENFTVAGH